jgi:hypothetical protein
MSISATYPWAIGSRSTLYVIEVNIIRMNFDLVHVLDLIVIYRDREIIVNGYSNPKIKYK